MSGIKDYNKFKSLIRNNDDESQYTNYDKCKTCDREFTCCQMAPCEIHPEDFVDLTVQSIIELLKTGLVVLDRYESIWFIRMRGNYGIEEDPLTIDEGIYGNLNQCVCLGKDGCKLEFQHRPFFGRRWMCDVDDDEEPSRDIAKAKWKPYQDMLKQAYDGYIDYISKDNKEGDLIRQLAVDITPDFISTDKLSKSELKHLHDIVKYIRDSLS